MMKNARVKVIARVKPRVVLVWEMEVRRWEGRGGRVQVVLGGFMEGVRGVAVE